MEINRVKTKKGEKKTNKQIKKERGTNKQNKQTDRQIKSCWCYRPTYIANF